MTDQPTGRAMAEAAARAMGWRKPSEHGRCDDCGWPLRKPEDAVGCERDRCSMVYNTELRADTTPEPTEREMLAWLHGRGEDGDGGLVTTNTCSSRAGAALCVSPDWVTPVASTDGPTLRDALMRLVVAVAEREAKA